LRLFGVSHAHDFLLRTPDEYSPELQPDGTWSKVQYDRLLDVALSEGHVAFEWVHQRLDGSSFEASVLFVRMQHGATTQVQVIVRDVSEQRRVARQLEEERLIHQRMELEIRAAQKLEAIGQLAAGIAHEINTPTQFASDSVHFLNDVLEAQHGLVERCRKLKQRFVDGDDATALAEEFEHAIQALDLDYFAEQGPAAVRNAIDGLTRIASIVRAMKEFSHPDSSEKCAADLNAALQNTLVVARNEYKYLAEVDAQFGDIPEVLCHVGALNQVFLNLIVNAAHAIADKVGNSGDMGKIAIQTSLEGNCVRIDISDNGTGVPKAARERIFEPFFTTKEVGRGTGQGLAIARSIVCGRHGGTIGFDTTEGAGTRFTIRIPTEGNSS
jgi:signal transduction histidine kinase